MDIPSRVVINTLAHPDSGFTICHFKDKKHAPAAPAHFHVVISLGDNLSIVVCIITSQMQQRADHYSGIGLEACLESMIPLDPSIFRFLSRGCVIDCNRAECLSLGELLGRVDESHPAGFTKKAEDGEFDGDLKERIINGIKNSPLVKDYIKKKVADLPLE